MSRKSTARDILSTPGYSPKNVIVGQNLYNPNSQSLAVLIPPWHGNSEGWPFNYLTWRLIRRGHAVLPYVFHNELLKPDAEQVLESFDEVQLQVANRLKELYQQYKTIHLIASSLGTTALAFIAEEFNDFKTATLIVPGHSLAYCMWNGIRTQHVRQGLEQSDNRWTYEELETLWQPIAPINHVEAFRGKQVVAYTSSTDRIIPFDSQRLIVDGLIEAGANVIEHSTSLGHYAAIGGYCLLGDLPKAA